MELVNNLKFAQSIIDLFNDSWKHSAKVVNKDINFMFINNPTAKVELKEGTYLNINCGDWIKNSVRYFDTKITDNKSFQEGFDNLCKSVIGRDFKMFRDNEETHRDWLESFINEQHGSGVSSLFWLYYNIKASDIKNIVIDNIDGFLHFLSMRQLGHTLREFGKDYKFIFLMNEYVLFTTSIFDIEDLYVLRGDEISNIQDCTDKKLTSAHNMEAILRAIDNNIL